MTDTTPKTWKDYLAEDSHLIWGASYKHLGKHRGPVCNPASGFKGSIPQDYLLAKCLSVDCFTERLLGEYLCDVHLKIQAEKKKAEKEQAPAKKPKTRSPFHSHFFCCNCHDVIDVDEDHGDCVLGVDYFDADLLERGRMWCSVCFLTRDIDDDARAKAKQEKAEAKADKIEMLAAEKEMRLQDKERKAKARQEIRQLKIEYEMRNQAIRDKMRADMLKEKGGLKGA
jgi:hypothetical protein